MVLIRYNLANLAPTVKADLMLCDHTIADGQLVIAMPCDCYQKVMAKHGMVPMPDGSDAPTLMPTAHGTEAKPTPSTCGGCGGAKFNPQAFNVPGGADQLIQQLG